jgi:hypothetical protein
MNDCIALTASGSVEPATFSIKCSRLGTKLKATCVLCWAGVSSADVCQAGGQRAGATTAVY